ncbi:hypothetical protein D3C80_1303810 [compost metagenome]
MGTRQIDIVPPEHTGLANKRSARVQFSQRQFQGLIEAHPMLTGERLLGRQEYSMILLEQLRAIVAAVQAQQVGPSARR